MCISLIGKMLIDIPSIHQKKVTNNDIINIENRESKEQSNPPTNFSTEGQGSVDVLRFGYCHNPK